MLKRADADPWTVALVFLGLLVPTLALFAAGVILSGWALSILWGWFMVPLLGLPSLSAPAAMGIALVVSFVTHQYSGDVAKDETKSSMTKILTAFAYIFGKPLMSLLVGWIIKSFI